VKIQKESGDRKYLLTYCARD